MMLQFSSKKIKEVMREVLAVNTQRMPTMQTITERAKDSFRRQLAGTASTIHSRVAANSTSKT